MSDEDPKITALNEGFQESLRSLLTGYMVRTRDLGMSREDVTVSIAGWCIGLAIDAIEAAGYGANNLIALVQGAIDRRAAAKRTKKIGEGN